MITEDAILNFIPTRVSGTGFSASQSQFKFRSGSVSVSGSGSGFRILAFPYALDIHESAMEAFLALIRYNELKIKRYPLHMCPLSDIQGSKKHVEGFSEQFFNCLRRYVGKHVVP